MTNFKGKEKPVNDFIQAVADDQWANWSDMLSLRLKEISEKEIDIEDKAAEISDLFEDYRELGYTEGVKDGLKMMITLYKNKLKPYIGTDKQKMAVDGFERHMTGLIFVNELELDKE